MSRLTIESTISGLIPVLETPFFADGRIDVDGFLVVLDRQLAAGADGVMFAGFASEFAKLTDAERGELETAMLSRTAGSTALGIVSVSDHATRNAVSHAERAQAAGADAINVLPPYQLAPPAHEVIAHLDAVLDAASSIPVVIQLAPALTGAALGLDAIERLTARHKNFAAIKVEAVPPGPMISALLGLPRPMPGLVGYAGLQLIDALRRGAVGVQPGSSFPELYAGILAAWNDGDVAEAERRHAQIVPYLSYWMQNVELIVQVEKTISHRRGWITSDYCRRPGRELDKYESDTVDKFIAQLLT